MVVAMLAKSLSITPMAMLSRQGMRGRVFIFSSLIGFVCVCVHVERVYVCE